MRKDLKSIDGQRIRFRGIVERFGTKKNYHGYPEPTILFKDVHRVDNEMLVTDHVWFSAGKTILALNLSAGDVVEFDARVGDYVKGYVNHREGIDDRTLDYKLNRPTRFSKICEGVAA